MLKTSNTGSLGLLLAAALAVGSRAAAAEPQQPADRAPATAHPAPRMRYTPDRFAGRAWKYYQLVWGVDSLKVRLAESGEIVRFSYRVLDPDKAQALNDGRNEPSLVDPRAGVKLVVPQLEKVGKLRQTGTPEVNKAYWMAFSNKGRPVKKGDRVDVVIGQFQARNLVFD